MRTKEELLDFLNRVVGEQYIVVEDDGDGGQKVDIKPYSHEITSNNTYSNTISGFVTFKGERLDDFNNSGRDMVKILIDCMNHAYSSSIKDCLAGDPDMLNQYKMSRFKFQ
jgi:hypothetical protein